MSVLNENTIIGASAASDYEIEQSLRFNSGDGSYLERTPSAASNRKTWTWSGWIKPATQGTQVLFTSYQDNSNRISLYFDSGSTQRLSLYGKVGNSLVYRLLTSRMFRDYSAWYHIVLAIDTTQGTAANRIKLYVNGEQVTAFESTAYPSQNTDASVNGTYKHVVGAMYWDNAIDTGTHLNGYLGEVNFIDGQALTPDSLGETGKYGEWNPIKYAGTYGTNGFYLPFEQDYSVEGMSTVIYEGTGVGQYVGGTGFKPDFIWGKSRGEARDHYLFDAVRGANNYLKSNTTGAAADHTQIQTSFDNDGFTVGTSTALNRDGYDHVAWCWDMGGTTASNTNGVITSSVRANQAYGQSIVSYSGASNATSDSSNNGGSYWTIGHGLAQAPEVVLVKTKNGQAAWYMGHQSLSANPWASGSHLQLQDTAANANESNILWGNAAPTSTVFKVGGWNVVNRANSTYIAYCFHSVTGYSKFSSYEGTGGTHTVTLGFTPAFLMIKNIDAVSSWSMWDNTRNPNNPVTQMLRANTSGAEETKTDREPSFTATGFTIGDADADTNASGQTYIYMAFADTREYAYWLDQSGNNNDWTSEGGLTESDVMVDSPTNNFATLNPLALGTDGTLSEGNLKLIYGGAGTRTATTATMGFASGKWYWEIAVNHNGGEVIGITNISDYTGIYPGHAAGSWGYYADDGNKYVEGTASSYGASYTAGDIISFALDMDAGTLVAYKNNSSQGTLVSNLTGDIYPAMGDGGAGGTTNNVLNFGQDSSFAGTKTPQGKQDSNGIGDFFYQPPSSFLALCTVNLPSVDVIPSENFNTVLYTGTASPATHTLGFRPNLIWGKRRSATQNHWLINDVGNINKRLSSDNNESEQSEANGTTFNSTGFTTANNDLFINNNSTYVVWGWKGNGTGSASSNSNGSITSQVSVNAAAGFSIVTYTGTGSNATVGHGLSKAPNMSWIKPRNFNDNWIVTYDAVDGSDDQAYLNLTSAGGSPASQYTVSQNATTLGLTSWNNVNDANDTYVAYCFHSVYGYSKVGKYVGNGNADGPMVHCGFKPAFLLLRRPTETGSWFIYDNTRGTTYNVSSGTNFDNVKNHKLSAENTGAEDADTSWNIDFLSNGFKPRSTHVYVNGQNINFIFLAFAENPFKHTNAS